MRQSSEVKIDANRHLKIWECTMKYANSECENHRADGAKLLLSRRES